MDDEMFRHIVEYNKQFYIRKWWFGWKYYHYNYDEWRKSVHAVPGKDNLADLELRWKLRGYQFVQWL